MIGPGRRDNATRRRRQAPSYPRRAPGESLREFARIVRDNRMAAERADFARHAWIVAGYLLGRIAEEDIQASGPTAGEQSHIALLCRAAHLPTELLGTGRVPWRWLLRFVLDQLADEIGF